MKKISTIAIGISDPIQVRNFALSQNVDILDCVDIDHHLTSNFNKIVWQEFHSSKQVYEWNSYTPESILDFIDYCMQNHIFYDYIYLRYRHGLRILLSQIILVFSSCKFHNSIIVVDLSSQDLGKDLLLPKALSRYNREQFDPGLNLAYFRRQS